MIKLQFFIIILLCMVVQGAWAQASWDKVYAKTNTAAADRTQLNVGSTTGQTIGTHLTVASFPLDADACRW